MRISLIVAMAENGVIGRDGGLPWRIPGDLKFVKATTTGKPIVMGRRTAESLGKPLPARLNIVMSRSGGPAGEGWVVVDGIEAALDAARRADLGEEVIVFGGADIFRLFFPLADRIYLTEVHRAVLGDTYFPPFDRSAWRETRREFHAGEQGGPDYSFVTLERIDRGERG